MLPAASIIIFSYLLHLHLFSFHDSGDHFEPQLLMFGALRRFLRTGPAVPRLGDAAIAQFSMRNRLKESQGETLKWQVGATCKIY